MPSDHLSRPAAARYARSARILADLIGRDHQRQFQGTYLGFAWALIEPALYMLMLYLVFAVGLRAQDTVDMPYVVYLVCGMTCWRYFSTALTGATDSLRTHAFLITKVRLDPTMLPLVRIFSTLTPQLALLALAIAVAWWRGFPPTWMTLQVIYYLMAMALLILGLGWLTASTSVFVPDVAHVVRVLVQFGFWLTPIVWNVAMIPERYQWLVKLNPAYYLVNGYRDSIVLGTPFWHRPDETLWFWAETAALLVAGYRVFARLRPHVCEVVS